MAIAILESDQKETALQTEIAADGHKSGQNRAASKNHRSTEMAKIS